MAERKVPTLVSATKFRSNLFDYLKQAKAGQEITVRHKGSAFRLISVPQGSKLERLAALPSVKVIDGTWKEFVRSGGDLSKDMRKAWEEKWNRKLTR
jgi:prevent-host-death family protein